MWARHLVLWHFALPIFLAQAPWAQGVKGKSKKPHIVFFLADDYGFADVGYHADMYGNSTNRVATPHLDRLSAGGVRLENYYVQPVCSPTRATLLTGRYVFHHGIHVPLIDSSGSALPLNETTLAQRLKSAGYRTHLVGKWHLGFKSADYTPQSRGFDTFFGYYAGSQDYWNHESLCWAGGIPNGCFENSTASGDPVTGLDLHRGAANINISKYSTVMYTEEAARIVREHAETFAASVPLFLYLPHQAVHVGNKPESSHPEYALDQAPQEYINRYSWVTDERRRNLSAMITVMDEAAGNITSVLKEVDMWNDTLFIMSTDNGGPTAQMASNYPLRGGKGTLWEGGVRGIGFLTGGNLAQFGIKNVPRVSRGLLHVSDWNPTLCDFAGGCPMEPAQPLDGVSARGLISGAGTNSSKLSNRTEIIHDLCRKWMGGSCLEHLSGDLDNPHAQYASMIRDDGYKLVVGQRGYGSGDTATSGTYSPRLFNVYRDPGEKEDLAATPAGGAIIKSMLERLNVANSGAGVAHDRDPIDPRSDPRRHGGVWVPWL